MKGELDRLWDWIKARNFSLQEIFFLGRRSERKVGFLFNSGRGRTIGMIVRRVLQRLLKFSNQNSMGYVPSVETVSVIFLFLTALHLYSYLILLMAATISTLELGRGTSHAPINCVQEKKGYGVNRLLPNDSLDIRDVFDSFSFKTFTINFLSCVVKTLNWDMEPDIWDVSFLKKKLNGSLTLALNVIPWWNDSSV